MIRNLLFTSFLLMATLSVQSQNTVGLLSYNFTQTYQGYTLIYPHNQPNVYLLNNCGEIVHSWTDEDNFRPGNTAYLRDDGTLVKTKRGATSNLDPIWAGGGGAIVEIRSWDNELLWSYELNTELERLHHDIEPLPNGNILMIAWESITMDAAVEAGRNPETLSQGELWPEKIIEIDPETDNIVWEWHVMDHIIQDFDATKENFGDIADHPELVDINYDTNDGKSDWLHVNSIDYNPLIDHIMISVPQFDEIWIIDHSTSTEEAAGHFGGSANHGGDLIYRVGNPKTHDKGDSTDQILFYQHDAHWVNEFISFSNPKFGHIVAFNNRIGADFSTMETFESSYDMYTLDYQQANGTWPPFEFTNTITHPEPTAFYSTGLSSVQLLPNGNTLGCSGRQGYIIELNSEGELVWEYKTPLIAGQAATQGDSLSLNNNLTFRAFKYPIDYLAFDGRDLDPKGHIELDPNVGFCDELTSTFTPEKISSKIFPNPARDLLHITWDSGEMVNIQIVDMLGRVHITEKGNGGMKYVDVSSLEPNVYFIQLNNYKAQKLVIH